MRIGIDWGGTTIKAAIVDGANLRGFTRVETRVEAGVGAVLDDIASLVRVLGGQPESVGLAIPGEVRDDGRCWRLPNVPGFENVNIAAELQARVGCPIGVENDAIAAALAERLFGLGNTYRSFLLVTLGTGIGGGLVLDGEVRRGRAGFSGEIGHVLIDSSKDAWPCGCGRTGCMEAYAGTAGLLRCYCEVKGSDPVSGTETGSDPLPVSIKQIAEAGGAAADAVWKQLGEALGTGLASINNVLDLDAVVFTGGVSNSFAKVEPHLREALKARAFAPPLGEIPLEVSKLGEHAGVIGAAHLPTERTASDSGRLFPTPSSQ
ncbi:MAG: ROK family protein [Planctomycetes bacterium]|nr:ROK family protein [Planctomycetota bacterium]